MKGRFGGGVGFAAESRKAIVIPVYVHSSEEHLTGSAAPALCQWAGAETDGVRPYGKIQIGVPVATME